MIRWEAHPSGNSRGLGVGSQLLGPQGPLELEMQGDVSHLRGTKRRRGFVTVWNIIMHHFDWDYEWSSTVIPTGFRVEGLRF